MKQLENKAFKEMIKRHEVKQVFSLLNDPDEDGVPSMRRIYVSTTAPVKMYIQYLVLEDLSCYKSVIEIDDYTYNTYWQDYLKQAKHMQEHPAAAEKEAAGCEAMQDDPETHMSHKKFWKIRNNAVRFMLKDKRIQEASNVSD